MTSYSFKIGAIIIAVFIALAIFAPYLAPHDPSEYHIERSFAGPSIEYPLGNDADGRDILSRIIYGMRVSLGVGISVVAISLIAGTFIGIFAGYAGGIPDKILGFISDVFLSFPSFLFALAVAAFLKPAVSNIIVLLALKGWVTYARLVRGQTLSLKNSEYIVAGRALGMGRARLFVKHLIPAMTGPIAVNLSFGLAGVIMVESALSFLGLGVPPDIPSLGAMIDSGTRYLLIAPHLSIFPGIAIMLIVLGFNFLGEGLRDKFAPKGR